MSTRSPDCLFNAIWTRYIISVLTSRRTATRNRQDRALPIRAEPVFAILLFAYSLDGAPVQVVDLTQTEARLPAEVIRWLFDPACIKHAYNAAFEWYCLSRFFHLEKNNSYPPEKWLPQWRCTMLHGLYCGYTAGLDATGKAWGSRRTSKSWRPARH